jgi:phytoene desaturase
MPDIFERFFYRFNKSVSDYYHLKRLDPSYRIYWADEHLNVPADYNKLKQVFDEIEYGASVKLDAFIKEAAYKYEVGMHKLVYKPGQSLTEFLNKDVLLGITKLDVFTSIRKHIAKYFTHPKLKELLEFPVLFLGALPQQTPALYSLMNYADIVGGTWYPESGMYSIVDAMYSLAKELNVVFNFNETVTEIVIDKNIAKKVLSVNEAGEEKVYDTDVVIGAADYHHIESSLLPDHSRTYNNSYWDKRVMAPGCIIFYVGLDKRLENITHHTLFFDTSFEQHGREIYITKQWPQAPLFYVSATSVTDKTVAPVGCENLFILIPVAAGLSGDTEALREQYFDMVMQRMEQHFKQPVANAVTYKRSFAYTDFVGEYNAFKGNAYGLANTLKQTAIFKPSCRSKKVKNLFYTGQLTVPGPGVPPSLISGEVVAKEAIKAFG